MISLRELWYGCWFSHAELIWESSHHRCLTCGTVLPVLPQATVRGPAHIPEPVRGQPLIRAVTQKVTPIKKRA